MQVRFAGVSTLVFDDGETAVMTDGFFSRPRFSKVAFLKIAPDLSEPEVDDVLDLAREIHRELPEKMKFARVWGEGRFAGQQVHRTEVLHDRDVVEIHE